MQRIGAALWPSLQVYQLYGANTNVGKTIVSTLLCNALLRSHETRVHYIKPVSTGPPDSADERHLSTHAPGAASRTLFQFSRPVSPHIAAQECGEAPNDLSILEQTWQALKERAEQSTGRSVAIVETAGGVLSPSPSGSLQADLYRTLRLPVILVGDHRLGGIAATISAYESLHVRGYDVWLHMIFRDDEYQNAAYLNGHFAAKGVQTLELPGPPEKQADERADIESLRSYYGTVSSSEKLQSALQYLKTKHEARLTNLASMPQRAVDVIWHPFTQHRGRTAKDVMVIDSAYNDSFAVLSPKANESANSSALQPAFDGSASWWTQGLGHGNPDLAFAAAHAAGRYGHVMFAGAVHEPALGLAERLLKLHQNPRLAKVFYTDNGSTGMEVAVKMALRAACKRYNWSKDKDAVHILGLKDCYHGDTIGVMDCAEPSAYNEKVDWYRPRG